MTRDDGVVKVYGFTSLPQRFLFRIDLMTIPSTNQGTWSEFTGQLWDKYFWGGEQVNKSNSLPRGGCETVVGPKVMFEAFEEFYSNLPKDVTHSIALEIVMTSCSMCR